MRQSALIGMIADENIPLADIAGFAILAVIEFENAPHEIAIDRRMKKHRRRNNQADIAIQNNAGEIA